MKLRERGPETSSEGPGFIAKKSSELLKKVPGVFPPPPETSFPNTGIPETGTIFTPETASPTGLGIEETSKSDRPKERVTVNSFFDAFAMHDNPHPVVEVLLDKSHTHSEKPEKLSRRERIKEKIKKKFYRKKEPIPELFADTTAVVGILNLKVFNKENLDEAIEITKGKKVIIFSNHLSNLDAPLIRRVLRESGYKKIAKEIDFIQGIKLDRTPFTNFLVRGFNRIRIWPKGVTAKNMADQQEQRAMFKESIESSKEAFQEKRPVVIFPEGGRSYSGQLKKAETAAASYLLLEPNTTAITMAITGTDLNLPPGTWLPSPFTPVTVTFGKPIKIDSLIEKYEGIKPKERREKIIDSIMRDIAQMLPLKYQGVYAEK